MKKGKSRMQITPEDQDSRLAKKAIESGNFDHASETLKRLFKQIAEEVAAGHSIDVIRNDRYYTPQEAAKLLKFSKSHLFKLMDEGAIPFVRVGTHRKIEAEDLLRYKETLQKERRSGFAEMARLGQDTDE